jgi:hypothetical protein
MGSNFNSLVAHKLSVELANELYLLVSDWPRFDQSTVGVQLIHADLSGRIAEIARTLNGLVKNPV